MNNVDRSVKIAEDRRIHHLAGKALCLTQMYLAFRVSASLMSTIWFKFYQLADLAELVGFGTVALAVILAERFAFQRL